LSTRAAEVGAATPAARRAVRAGGLATWVPYAVLVGAAWWAMLAAMPPGAGPLDAISGAGGASHAAHAGGAAAHGVAHAGAGLGLAMWALMTCAMMAPTAVPMLRALHEVAGRARAATWWGFLGGYLATWLAWSAAAFAAQRALALGVAGALPDAAEADVARWGAAAVLAAAGLYQFTRLKERCLTECLRPMTFLLAHWREGLRGGAAMGARHGATCVGCCWALMSLAFVGGAWSAASMAAMTALMVLEKAPAVGRRLAAPVGVALVAAAALRLA
jgi:predicted metal-binding membrane protein